uniref:Paired domain-containing protein n=1 Tax=Strongyloides stercoralis TaxID=6248 RepID=A0A0K0EHL2_STRER
MNIIGSENLYTIYDNNEISQDLKLRNVIFTEQLQWYYQQQERLKLFNNTNIMPSAFKPVDCGTLALSLQLSTTSLLNNMPSPFIFSINTNNNNNNNNSDIIFDNCIINKNQQSTEDNYYLFSNNTNNSVASYYQVTRNRHGRPYNPGRPLEMVDRQKILTLFQQGYKVSHIAKIIGVTHSCVSKIMTRYKKTGSINPRSSQIKKYHGINEHSSLVLSTPRILNSPSGSSSYSQVSSCSSITSSEVDNNSNYDSLPKPVPTKNTYHIDRFMQ